MVGVDAVSLGVLLWNNSFAPIKAQTIVLKRQLLDNSGPLRQFRKSTLVLIQRGIPIRPLAKLEINSEQLTSNCFVVGVVRVRKEADTRDWTGC